MKQVKKNMRVLKELFLLRFHDLTVFRLDFFAPFFIDGSLFVIQLLTFHVIYANVDTIGSWQKGEMILYIGTFSLLNAINMTIYFFGITGIPGKIRSGELDLYLSKPISPLFRLTFENINPGSLPLVLMSIFIILYGTATLHIKPTAGKITAYLFWIIIMAVLYYEVSMIGEMSPSLAAYGIGVVILFTFITGVTWKRGLKHYNSASS